MLKDLKDFTIKDIMLLRLKTLYSPTISEYYAFSFSAKASFLPYFYYFLVYMMNVALLIYGVNKNMAVLILAGQIGIYECVR
jgi:hypothetical protein